MDPVTLWEIIGAFVVGGIGGLGIGLKRGRSSGTGKTTLMCSCGNPLSSHDPETGACVAQIRRVMYDMSGYKTGYEYVTCPCRRYDGPPTQHGVMPNWYTNF